MQTRPRVLIALLLSFFILSSSSVSAQKGKKEPKANIVAVGILQCPKKGTTTAHKMLYLVTRINTGKRRVIVATFDLGTRKGKLLPTRFLGKSKKPMLGKFHTDDHRLKVTLTEGNWKSKIGDLKVKVVCQKINR